jgi:hypothetical protein
MEYLQQEGAVFTSKQLIDLLHVAGVNGSLQVAKWLRQHSAEWPDILRLDSDRTQIQWRDDAVAWARDEGCTSPIE